MYSYKSWNGQDSGIQLFPTHKKIWRYVKAVDEQGKPYRYSVLTVVPAWKKRRIRVDNSYTCTWEIVHNEQMFDSVNGAYQGWFYNSYGMPDDPAILDFQIANARIKAVNRLAAKIAGHDFNAAVFLAEGGESLHMIASSATKLYNAFKALKHGNFSAASKLLTGHPGNRNVGHTLSQNVLELQYGWRPLLNDVYDATEAIASIVAKHSTLRESTTIHLGAQLPLDVPGQATFSSNYRTFKERIVAKVSRDMSYISSTGLTSPAEVVWELVPFSFVVDWFIPVGAYLEALHSAASMSGTFVTSTKQERLTSGGETTVGWRVNAGANSYNTGNFSRSVSTSLSVPMPRPKPLAKSLSMEHCLNALSLLNGVFENIQR
jgi:hypothetical protein